MTPEDWEKVIKLERSWTGARVKLAIDGFEVIIKRERLKKTQDIFMVYINGWFKGEWLNNDCEERRRFYQCKKLYLYSGKQRQNLIKESVNKKRSADYRKWCKEQLDAQTFIYTPQWRSLASFKRHLIANNKSIELIEE